MNRTVQVYMSPAPQMVQYFLMPIIKPLLYSMQSPSVAKQNLSRENTSKKCTESERIEFSTCHNHIVLSMILSSLTISGYKGSCTKLDIVSHQDILGKTKTIKHSIQCIH